MTVASAIVALVVLLAGGSDPRASLPVASRRLAECYGARAVPVYHGLGWTHFVDVANGCATAIACEVATDVDPFPTYSIMVPPRETRRVRTRTGSRTNRFVPLVRCTVT